MKTVPPDRSPRRGARADWQLSRPQPPASSRILDDLIDDGRIPWRPGYYELGLEGAGTSFVDRVWINSYAHRDELLAGYKAGGIGCYAVDWDGDR